MENSFLMEKRNIDDYKDRMTSLIGITVITENPEEEYVIVEGAIPFKPITVEEL